MRISFSFNTLKDLSALSKGERFLEILSSNGLCIEKASTCEPIRGDFEASKLPDMWKGVGPKGGHSTCCFLFKGKTEISFSGMVIWDIDLPPGSKALNSISLWLNIRKSYDLCRLIKLGDDIFTWAEAIYGYITENSKYQPNLIAGNIYSGLPGLMWANYFGRAYINEPDFHIPDEQVPVGHGIRFNLTETPNDEKLSDSDFLRSRMDEIGYDWFWHRPANYKKKLPVFDNSQITRR